MDLRFVVTQEKVILKITNACSPTAAHVVFPSQARAVATKLCCSTLDSEARMASHLYHFLTRWRLEATAEEAFRLIDSVPDYVRWGWSEESQPCPNNPLPQTGHAN